jgi:D-threonate/D-erythronate kinase
MIVVIADDFTGAAELAGISLRFGLNVKLYTKLPDEKTEADVIVISTDSRSKNKKKALDITREIVEKVQEWKPELVYKKIDSVMRGYVVDELNLQMELMNKKRAFILPANPSLERKIINGNYYVQGELIAETGFANDPEFPIKSSLVRTILDNKAEVIKINDELHLKGLMIGEAGSVEDIFKWAKKVDESFVIAGAGDFYAALLEQRFNKKEQGSFQVQFPFLYVCGTAYKRSVDFVKSISDSSGMVAYITEKMLSSLKPDEDWLKKINGIINENRNAILAFDAEQIPGGVPAVSLRKRMAGILKWVVQQNHIAELLIEGGSTATAILEELSITELIPVNELSRGAVRMKSASFYITVKPGSYELPPAIINLYS